MIRWVLFLLVSVSAQKPRVLFSWKTVDYTWPSAEVRAEALLTGAYIPLNNAVAGVKVDANGTVYVSVPRWLRGVPATLCTVDPTSNLLVPFPSWEAQSVLFSYVQSMEIDSRNWLWILDVGRLNLFDDPRYFVNNLGPKLVVYDLNSGCLVRVHFFPDDVMAGNNTFANDLVIDETKGLVYISDTWANGGLVVYNWFTDTSRRFNHASLQGDPNNIITINGVGFPLSAPSDGIALTPDTNWVYYSSISTRLLWRVPTAALSNFSLSSDDIGKTVQLVTKTKGYSDGLAFDSNGVLYFGRNENNDLLSVVGSSEKLVLHNNVTNIWIDTFAFSNKQLLWTSNKLPFYLHHNISSTDTNFRVWTAFIGADSYLTRNPLPRSAPCLSVPKPQ